MLSEGSLKAILLAQRYINHYHGKMHQFPNICLHGNTWAGKCYCLLHNKSTERGIKRKKIRPSGLVIKIILRRVLFEKVQYTGDCRLTGRFAYDRTNLQVLQSTIIRRKNQ